MNPREMYTYHCICSTHLLTTPYSISSLPQRAAPSLDCAKILPLPPFLTPTSCKAFDDPTSQSPLQTPNNNESSPSENTKDRASKDGRTDGSDSDSVLPSLTSPSFRPTRKVIVVQRTDGWEKRRVWRCGRCGLGVGYEVLREDQGKEGKKEGKGRVLFLLEGSLVATGEWGEAG